VASLLLLQATPALSQVPPWAQQDRRRMIPAPQHAVRPAPQNAPQQQTRQPQAQQQQQAAPQPSRTKPEPIQNVAERAACLNKDTPQAALIEACRVVIEAGKDRPATMATMY